MWPEKADPEDLNRCPEVTDKGRRAWQKGWFGAKGRSEVSLS